MTDQEKITALNSIADLLCDCINDQPAGCDACVLNDTMEYQDDEGVCEFRRLQQELDK